MSAEGTVRLKEFDGGRMAEFEVCGDYVIVETGYHAFTFDAALMLHAMRRLFAANVDSALP